MEGRGSSADSGLFHRYAFLFILYKKKGALRIITFSAFDHPSSPFFKSLGITQFFDLVTYHIFFKEVKPLITLSSQK